MLQCSHARAYERRVFAARACCAYSAARRTSSASALGSVNDEGSRATSEFVLMPSPNTTSSTGVIRCGIRSSSWAMDERNVLENKAESSVVEVSEFGDGLCAMCHSRGRLRHMVTSEGDVRRRAILVCSKPSPEDDPSRSCASF